MTAFSNWFSGGRPSQHHSASSDCTNHKRRLMQQCLCCFWRHHCSHDLCWSSWWGQRCMPGKRVRRKIIISEHFVFATNTRENFIITVKIFWNIIGPMSTYNRQRSPLYQHQCRSQIDMLIYSVLLWFILQSKGCFWNYKIRKFLENYFGSILWIS